MGSTLSSNRKFPRRKTLGPTESSQNRRLLRCHGHTVTLLSGGSTHAQARAGRQASRQAQERAQAQRRERERTIGHGDKSWFTLLAVKDHKDEDDVYDYGYALRNSLKRLGLEVLSDVDKGLICETLGFRPDSRCPFDSTSPRHC